jgi:DNA-binding MarR family transcriptional regulator
MQLHLYSSGALVNVDAIALNCYIAAMTRMPSKTVVRAWARLMKAQRNALAGVEAALKDAGLPPLAWYDVLLEVERAGEEGVRPFELERALLLAQYNLSRLLDRIEREGYIERAACLEDRRGQIVRISERGKTLRRTMWPVYAGAIEAHVGRRLADFEAAALDALLGRLIEPQSGEA